MDATVSHRSRIRILLGLLLMTVCGSGFYLYRTDLIRRAWFKHLDAPILQSEKRLLDASASAIHDTVETGDASSCEALPQEFEVKLSNRHTRYTPRKTCYEKVLAETKNPDYCRSLSRAEPGHPDAQWMDDAEQDCLLTYGRLGQSEKGCLQVKDPENREMCLYGIPGVKKIPDASRKNVISHPDLSGNLYVLIDGNIVKLHFDGKGGFSKKTLLDLPVEITSVSLNRERTALLFTEWKSPERPAPGEVPALGDTLGYYDFSSGMQKIIFEANDKNQRIRDIPIFGVGGRTAFFTAGRPKTIVFNDGIVRNVPGFKALPNEECMNAPSFVDPTGTAVAVRYSCIEGSGTRVLDLRDGKVLLDVYNYIGGKAFCGFVDGGAYASVDLGDEMDPQEDAAFPQLTVRNFDGTMRDDVSRRVRSRLSELSQDGGGSVCDDILRLGGYGNVTPNGVGRDDKITIESDGVHKGSLWLRHPETNDLERLIDVDAIALTAHSTDYYSRYEE